MAQSHIIHWLQTRKLNSISVPPASAWAGVPVACYVCGSRNVFSLGLINDRVGRVYYVCRNRCVDDDRIGFDGDSFVDLIQDNRFLEDFISIPAAGQYRSVTIASTMAIAPELLESRSSLRAAPFQYDSYAAFRAQMQRFVEAERAEAHRITSSVHMDGLDFVWGQGGDEVEFTLPPRFNRLVDVGASLLFTRPGDSAKGEVGQVIATGTPQVVARGSVVVTVTVSFPQRSRFCHERRDLVVDLAVSDAPFKRELRALDALGEDSLRFHWMIGELLLGITEKMEGHNRKGLKHWIVNFPSPRGLPPLNKPQETAVRTAAVQRFTMIQGPAGTGKTMVIAALCQLLVANGIRPLLVCAHSNFAVDCVTHRLSASGLNVVRALSAARERTNAGPLTLAEREKETGLSRAVILQGADVVCATCVTSGGRELRDMCFRSVIFDEAGQIVDPDLLIALSHRAEQCVLVGDHRQLGPVILAREARKAGYEATLMRRLVQLGVRPLFLCRHYRMHPFIAKFVSDTFYSGLLRDGDLPVLHDLELPEPLDTHPLVFWNLPKSADTIADAGNGYINTTEARAVKSAVQALIGAGVTPERLVVLTPYVGQLTLLAADLEGVEVVSVDAFQGRECDFAVLSLVRANTGGEVGFLRDARRMNVALTRARYALVVVGSAETFAAHKLWARLLKYTSDAGTFVEGEEVSLWNRASFDGALNMRFGGAFPEDDEEVEL